MPQSKSATNAIETGSTAVCALAVGAFAVGAAAIAPTAMTNRSFWRKPTAKLSEFLETRFSQSF